MNDSDHKPFGQMLKATLEVYGSVPSAAAVAIWWGALRRFEFDRVRAAMAAHIESPRGHFAPKPADLITWLNEQDGQPGPDEAWAIVSQTLNDERITVFWTAPMQRAFGVAISLQDDPIAARKAFLEVYGKGLNEARLRGETPQWSMSPGTDKLGRDAAIADAIRLGRLPEHQAVGLLSHHAQPPAWLEQQFPALKALDVPGAGIRPAK